MQTTIDLSSNALAPRFGTTQTAIAEIAAKCQSLKADTPLGYSRIVGALIEIKKLRGSIEARRKELKKDILAAGRHIDGLAAELTSLLVEVEEPLRLKKHAVDHAAEIQLAQEKAEAERLAEEDRLAILAAERQSIEADRKALRDSLAAVEAERATLKAEREAVRRLQDAQETPSAEPQPDPYEAQARIDTVVAAKTQEAEYPTAYITKVSVKPVAADNSMPRVPNWYLLAATPTWRSAIEALEAQRSAGMDGSGDDLDWSEGYVAATNDAIALVTKLWGDA